MRRPATRELGRRLAAVSYPVEHGVKNVRYWAARALGGEFAPDSEVDELIWLPSGRDETAQYPHDRKVLRRFAKQPADTGTVLMVRHGTAGSKSSYKGDDREAAAGQEWPRAGRVTGRSAAGVRRHRCPRRPPSAVLPDARTAGRGAGCDDHRRADAHRGGLRRRPRGGADGGSGDREPMAHRRSALRAR